MEKKGMSPWAWVAIGCGGVLVVGFIVVAALGVFAVKKGKEIAEEAERNPAHATAKLLAKFNPEIEVVDSDDEAQTVTIRNKATGKTTTVDLDGLKDGKIAWETEEGRSEISTDVDGQGQGKINFNGADGQTAQFGNAVDMPEWVPLLPDGEASGVAAVNGTEGSNGMIRIETDETPADVIAWYKKNLEDQGYTIDSTNSMSSNGDIMEMIKAGHTQKGRTVSVSASASPDERPGTQVNVSYTTR